MTSIAFSVDRLVVIELDPDLPREEAVSNARQHAADEFGRMMDSYDGDEETIIEFEEYEDE